MVHQTRSVLDTDNQHMQHLAYIDRISRRRLSFIALFNTIFLHTVKKYLRMNFTLVILTMEVMNQ